MDRNTVEIRHGLTSVRELQSAILNLARSASREPDRKAILVLVEPKMTEDRLRHEELEIRQMLKPDLAARLVVLIKRREVYSGLPENTAGRWKDRLNEMLQKESQRDRISSRQGKSYYEILKVLIHQWLRREGPLKSSWLVETTGYSYPSVAGALHRLSDYIVRHSNRSVELTRFPTEEWTRLLANADSIRSTRRYKDISNQQSSPSRLLKRIQNMGLENISVGGVFGSKHYFSELNLVGSPRLDLSIHSPEGSADLSFVERVDPALKETTNRQDPVKLAVHFIQRRRSFFERDSSDNIWADPVECLLDLSEAKLESQAKEFLENLTLERKASA